MQEACHPDAPCITAAVLLERLAANERLRELERCELDERLDKLESKIDQALAERNMAIGVATFLARIGGLLMVAIPIIGWAYDRGFFDSLRNHPPVK